MAIYSGIECQIEKYRARHDIMNPIYGGLITGGGVGMWQNRYLGASSEDAAVIEAPEVCAAATLIPCQHAERSSFMLILSQAALSPAQRLCAGACSPHFAVKGRICRDPVPPEPQIDSETAVRDIGLVP